MPSRVSVLKVSVRPRMGSFGARSTVLITLRCCHGGASCQPASTRSRRRFSTRCCHDDVAPGSARKSSGDGDEDDQCRRFDDLFDGAENVARYAAERPPRKRNHHRGRTVAPIATTSGVHQPAAGAAAAVPSARPTAAWRHTDLAHPVGPEPGCRRSPAASPSRRRRGPEPRRGRRPHRKRRTAARPSGVRRAQTSEPAPSRPARRRRTCRGGILEDLETTLTRHAAGDGVGESGEPVLVEGAGHRHPHDEGHRRRDARRRRPRPSRPRHRRRARPISARRPETTGPTAPGAAPSGSESGSTSGTGPRPEIQHGWRTALASFRTS